MGVRSVFKSASEDCENAPSVHMSVTLRASIHHHFLCMRNSQAYFGVFSSPSSLAPASFWTFGKVNYHRHLGATQIDFFFGGGGRGSKHKLTNAPLHGSSRVHLQSFESERPRCDTTTFITMSSAHTQACTSIVLVDSTAKNAHACWPLWSVVRHRSTSAQPTTRTRSWQGAGTDLQHRERIPCTHRRHKEPRRVHTRKRL